MSSGGERGVHGLPEPSELKEGDVSSCWPYGRGVHRRLESKLRVSLSELKESGQTLEVKES